MYTNQRRVRARVSDDSVMRDVMMEMHDLRASVLRAGASQTCVSHVVHEKFSISPILPRASCECVRAARTNESLQQTVTFTTAPRPL
jgi:hypothetical protein